MIDAKNTIFEIDKKIEKKEIEINNFEEKISIKKEEKKMIKKQETTLKTIKKHLENYVHNYKKNQEMFEEISKQIIEVTEEYKKLEGELLVQINNLTERKSDLNKLLSAKNALNKIVEI